MIDRLALEMIRLALKAFPRRFRDAYAQDMSDFFADRWRASSGFWNRGALFIRSVASLLIAAASEHARPSDAVARPVEIRGPRGGIVNSVLQDVRFALRLMRRQPSYALFVVLTLAIGIGANTAVFSVVNGVLLKPLPFAESDRLVAIWGRFDPESGFDFPRFVLSIPEYLDYRNQSRSYEEVAAWATASLTVGGEGVEPERVTGAAVTENLFRLLRVAPVFGRTFSAEEARPGGPPLIVLSHAYWQSRFGGARDIVGRTVPINGRTATVIGVMPQDFSYPDRTTRIWTMLRIDPANPGGRSSHSYRAIGRLASGASIESARNELQPLMASWKAAYPDIHTGHYLFIRPLLEDVSGTIKPALLMLLGATGAVLLIVCANLATVIMARGEARSREMAIRGALGARKSRLVRLSLIESALLALLGGVLGVLIAQAGVRALLTIDPTSIPRSSEVTVDGRMLAFAAGLSFVSALLFGLLPALRGSSPELVSTLKESNSTVSGGAGRQWVRRGLVAVEVALSVVLVVGAGLMLRSFERLLSVQPGFDARGMLMASITLPGVSYGEPERVEGFYEQLIARLRSVPGVRAASAGSGVPLWSDTGVWDFDIEGKPRPGRGETAWNAGITVVRDQFFETLGIKLVRGRFFDSTDRSGTMPVSRHQRKHGRAVFPGVDPIGRRIRVSGDQNAWMTIVGLAADIRDQSLDDPPRPMYYVVQAQMPVTARGPYSDMTLVVRSAIAPEALIPSIRDIIRQLDPKLPIYDAQSLETVRALSVARPRFTTTLLTLFAVVGIMLGATGIYGVLSYSVARRTQEIGIRRALGAATGALFREVIARGMRPVIAGLILGLVACYWMMRILENQLFEVSTTDPATYAIVAAGVVVVSLIACAVPALRAIRVNPIIALRAG